MGTIRIDVNFIADLLQNYLDNKTSMAKISEVASEILFNDENEKYTVSGDEELINKILHSLEGASSETWQKLGREDLELLHQLIVEVTDSEELKKILFLVELRGPLLDLLKNVLAADINMLSAKKEIDGWNLDGRLKERIILVIENKRDVGILMESFENNDLDQILTILKLRHVE